MINVRVDQNSKSVYVDVSGWITMKMRFFIRYKQLISIKKIHNIFIVPSKFEVKMLAI